MKFVEIFATVLTIVSLFLLSEQILIAGFTVGIMSNILWLLYAEQKQLIGIGVVNAILIFINLNGLGVI